MNWKPLDIGPTNIDWMGLVNLCRVDPYLAWFDATDFVAMVSRDGRRPLPLRLIIELEDDLSPAAQATLASLGITVDDQYLWPPVSRFVAASVADESAIGALQLHMCSKQQPLVLRFEISQGFPQPALLPLGQPAPAAASAPRPPLDADIVGFIDHGCPFARRSLRTADGKGTRVAALWNQQIDPPGAPPGKTPLTWKSVPGFNKHLGSEALAADFNVYVDQFRKGDVVDEEACYRNAGYEAITERATHASHITDVATGWPSPLKHLETSAQGQHDALIVFVQLPRRVEDQQVSGLLRAQVLDGMRYIVSLLKGDRHAVVNLSYGSYCGPHDGSSLIERAIDALAEKLTFGSDRRLQVVVPTGNALRSDIHAQVLLRSKGCETLMWQNMPDDPSESFVEIWLPPSARIRLRVVPPGMHADECVWLGPGEGRKLVRDTAAVASVVYAKSVCQSDRGTMILLAVGPTATGGGRPVAPYGQWRIELESADARAVVIDAWCERDDPVFGSEGGPRQSFFASHVEPTGTLNSIAHGYRTVVVGGHLQHPDLSEPPKGVETRPVAEYSGAGPGRGLQGRLRHPQQGGIELPAPDVLAPSEMRLEMPGLTAAAVLSEDTVRLSGTSVAAAAVTRFIVDSNFKPPWPTAARNCVTVPHGEEPHPDDCERIPRIP